MAIPKTVTWKMEPQTWAKHQILRNYLEGWFGVMGQTNNKILFIDAFAGPGRYEDGSPGSPLIALDTLLKHPVINKKCEFILLFNENVKARADHLMSILEVGEKSNPMPKNVTVFPTNMDFVELSAEIASIFTGTQERLVPTFAFIDPFGFSDSPLTALSDLLSFPKCELLTFLGLNSINRFATAKNVAGHMESLFGTSKVFEHAPHAGDPNRITFFVKLYEDQLKATCGFKYCRTFIMKNKSGLEIYALVFATKNVKGLDLMKKSMWKMAPDGRFTFSASDFGRETLFDSVVDYDSLASEIHEYFRGRTVHMQSIEEFALIHTAFLVSHVRTSLTILEGDGKLKALNTVNKNRRGKTFPEWIVIQFLN
jgi:three-Cys-motif partner protein